MGMDGPAYKVLSALFDMMWVTILWFVFGGGLVFMASQFIPSGNMFFTVVTLLLLLCSILLEGPGITASFAALGKLARGEESYTFRDFWKSYKQNFKQGIQLAAILGIILGVLIYLIWFEFENIDYMGSWVLFSFAIQVSFGVELIFVSIYAFSMLARFEITTKQLLKTSFALANKHLPTSLLCLAMLAGCVYLVGWVNQMLLIFIFGLYIYLCSLLLERVFRKYMPKEEVLTTEEEEEGYVLDNTQEDAAETAARAEQMDAERAAIIARYTGTSVPFNDDVTADHKHSDGGAESTSAETEGASSTSEDTSEESSPNTAEEAQQTAEEQKKQEERQKKLDDERQAIIDKYSKGKK